ncbi:MAG: hypothetical protein L3J67_12070, partial [Hyphomicrobiaceae bacterium]|nr:hypothetical protein [Hyphomicrobiaceae bacterium]
SQAQLAKRKKTLARYDLYRQINAEQQSRIVADIINEEALEIALRIGLLQTPKELAEKSIDELVPALDLALYATDGEGSSILARELEAWPKTLNQNERIMFEAMSHSLFSIFEVVGKHEIAGLVMRDLFSDEELWVVDRGLEANAPDGLKIAIRLINPGEFWMSTGGNVILDENMLEEIRQAFPVERGQHPHPDRLAEFVFKSHFARSHND